MKILVKDTDQKIILSSNQTFKTDLGWTDSAQQMEQEILYDIINPTENYETIRYIHSPYSVTSTSGTTFTQTDIWYNFYFLNNAGVYNQNYESVDITLKENAKMLRQSTESFFRLEFYKTSNDNAPNQTNRRLVFSKNLILPLGEKVYFTGTPSGSTLPLNDFVFLPVFTGSNYRNTENMYFFWFLDDTPFSETNITGNTFYMTAKFYNAKTGQFIKMMNECQCNFTSQTDIQNFDVIKYFYYRVVLDYTNISYRVFDITSNQRVGSTTPIKWYEYVGP